MATMTTTYGNTVNSVFRAYTSGSYTTSDTQYVFSITGGLNIPTKGYKSTRSFTSTVYVGSTSLGSGSIAAATRYGVLTTAIKTVSYTVTRTHSAQTVTFKSILQGSAIQFLITLMAVLLLVVKYHQQLNGIMKLIQFKVARLRELDTLLQDGILIHQELEQLIRLVQVTLQMQL